MLPETNNVTFVAGQCIRRVVAVGWPNDLAEIVQ